MNFTSERAWRRASQWMVFDFLLQDLSNKVLQRLDKHCSIGYIESTEFKFEVISDHQGYLKVTMVSEATKMTF